MPLVLSMALWGYKGMGTSVRWVVGSPCLLQGVFEDRCRRNVCHRNRQKLLYPTLYTLLHLMIFFKNNTVICEVVGPQKVMRAVS